MVSMGSKIPCNCFEILAYSTQNISIQVPFKQKNLSWKYLPIYIIISHPNLLSNHVQKEATSVWLMEQIIIYVCTVTIDSRCMHINICNSTMFNYISVFVVNIIHSYIR